MPRSLLFSILIAISALGIPSQASAAEVEGQPLGANLVRVAKALEFLGVPLSLATVQAIEQAAHDRDREALQTAMDPFVLAKVSINPEMRVSVTRGDAPGRLQQGGYTPVLIKVYNHASVTRALAIDSPQAGAVYGGASLGILERQAQTELNAKENLTQASDRFLDIEMFHRSPMTAQLSGLELEYVIALVHCSEHGKREATLVFDVGQGTQDLGFRSELPVLFEISPAVAMSLRIRDVDGAPTVARLTFRDKHGHVYPPQAKRLAPDFFFQPHIYRRDGDPVSLPPGEFIMTSSRGPEYVDQQTAIVVSSKPTEINVPLKRWIQPMDHGYYVGDHHIHGAGCSHYTMPTEGVLPEHMLVQVKGEALNVGCVLTWGPCYDYQRQFFSPKIDTLSEPHTIVKYDVEVSGFGSAALGHVCLLNLTDQTYPGSEGRKDIGWPTWTVPVMRWCKQQGGVTGYPHSAIGVDAQDGAQWLLERHDTDANGRLSKDEARLALLPEDFGVVDEDGDRQLAETELTTSLNRGADTLPNVAIPAMNGSGGMEIFVSVPEGVCDFISAMDTSRISEWNTWYHLMNCGFPLKLSGETDFPCMSSRRVGQGRVYVQLGQVETLDYPSWCRALAEGRSYVSDGYAHAMDFTVNSIRAGDGNILLDEGGAVTVESIVSFAQTLPEAVAYGTLTPVQGKRRVGDTVNLHAPRTERVVERVEHLVEVVVNGQVVASQTVFGDGEPHPVTFEVPVTQSAWIALRSFPQLHTNPVNVLIQGKPIRASKESARWCEEAVLRLWDKRSTFISDHERLDARAAYDRALEVYRKIATES